MSDSAINQILQALTSTLGRELELDISRMLHAIFNEKLIYIGFRDEYELVINNVQLGGLSFFKDNNESTINLKFKPKEFLENDDDFYFGAEEIIRFNERQSFLGIIGEKWFTNNMEDEFVEAIIFGNHNVLSVRGMYGSVRVNNRFREKTYLSPGAIVVLNIVEFKSTKYLELSQYLTKLFLSNDSKNPWKICDFQGRYYWSGTEYYPLPVFDYSEIQDENSFEENEIDEEYYDEDIDYDYMQGMEYDEDGGPYSRYGGGPNGELTDDFIDDVLGGEPDAYWNID